jgi:AraC-like DNA-binding protein
LVRDTLHEDPAMNQMTEQLPLTSSDPTFALCEVAAMMATLSQRGIPTHALLKDCHVQVESLTDPAVRISLDQLSELYRAAASLYGDSRLLPRTAQRLNLTSFGIVGYALLSCESLCDLFRFADAYAPLLNLKFRLLVDSEGSSARLRLLDRYELDDDARAAFMVLELAKIGVLLRHVLGEAFKPVRASCVGANDAQLEELARILGCPVEASEARAEICFDAGLLERGLPQSNAATHSSCRQVCDELMSKLTSHFDLKRHVRDIMLQATERPPTLQELAEALCMSQRTLRRRLDALGTSYNQILEDVRRELAIRYLSTTPWTTEQIAQSLGYSDSANFRQAFKRWTGKSPRDYRANGSPESPTAGRPHVVAGKRAPRNPGRTQHNTLLTEAVSCWARPGYSAQFVGDTA